jgi:hypothetical protein
MQRARRMCPGVKPMLLSATSVLLGFWLAVVWYCDIDGFRARRRDKSPAAGAARHRGNPAAPAAIDSGGGDVARPDR